MKNLIVIKKYYPITFTYIPSFPHSQTNLKIEVPQITGQPFFVFNKLPSKNKVQCRALIFFVAFLVHTVFGFSWAYLLLLVKEKKYFCWVPTSQAVPKLSCEPASPQRQPAGISQVIFVLKDKEKKTIPCQRKQAKGTYSRSLKYRSQEHKFVSVYRHTSCMKVFSFLKRKLWESVLLNSQREIQETEMLNYYFYWQCFYFVWWLSWIWT